MIEILLKVALNTIKQTKTLPVTGAMLYIIYYVMTGSQYW